MKKIVALLLALLSVLMCFASCTPNPSPTTTPTISPTPTEETEPQCFVGKSDYVYKSFIYYQSINLNDLTSSTIKYQNLKKAQSEGLNLYNDALGQGDDPFKSIASAYIIVDENSTKENGGLPIVILAANYSAVTDGDESKKTQSRIVLYNQASLQIKVLYENDSGEQIQGACLYGDTVYFKKWTVNENGKSEYIYCSVKTDGKDLKTYPLSISTQTEYMGIYSGTVYLKDLQSRRILTTDRNFEKSKKLMSYKISSTGFTPIIDGGYIYYAENEHDVTLGDTSFKAVDIYKKSLDDFENAEAEPVIQNVTLASVCNGNIVYCDASDAVIAEYQETAYASNPLIKQYDVKSGNTKVVFDRRGDEDGSFPIAYIGCNGEYLWFYTETFNMRTSYNCYVDILTGESAKFSYYEK